jgi:hypothetical protein
VTRASAKKEADSSAALRNDNKRAGNDNNNDNNRNRNRGLQLQPQIPFGDGNKKGNGRFLRCGMATKERMEWQEQMNGR